MGEPGWNGFGRQRHGLGRLCWRLNRDLDLTHRCVGVLHLCHREVQHGQVQRYNSRNYGHALA